jgi:hypothetical protein
MAAFLHFDKVMQIPFILLHKLGGLTFKELIEVFTSERIQTFPILSEINTAFIEAAKRIQNGGAEYFESKERLNIWWPDDEFQLIRLCTENRLSSFYKESELLLRGLLKEKCIEVPTLLLQEAIHLNQSLIKLPNQTNDLEIEFAYNVWEVYQNYLIGIDSPIEENSCKHLIDRTSETWESWEEWCQKVIWYGNKKGAYLYKLILIDNLTTVSYLEQTSEKQISGHY